MKDGEKIFWLIVVVIVILAVFSEAGGYNDSEQHYNEPGQTTGTYHQPIGAQRF